MEHALPKEEIDRFSDLSEDVIIHILSFLPTKLAARTSLLARRFRRLWETCSALEINIEDLLQSSSDLVELTNRTLLHRNPPSPLHHLSLCLFTILTPYTITSSFISSLLNKAASLDLRHLTVELDSDMLPTVLPLILSISSLESLSLSLHLFQGTLGTPVISTAVTLTHLKSLSIFCEFASALHSDELNWLLSKLNVLEDLYLNWQYAAGKAGYDEYALKSTSVKRLKLVMSMHNLMIFAPSLEFIEFKSVTSAQLRSFHGDMPLLRKAVMQFNGVYAHTAPAIFQMLMAISHVEELHLDIAESRDQNDIFRAFPVPSVDPPTFIRLKCFHVENCFHELNLVDLVTIIQHSPALESLKLVDKPPTSKNNTRERLWISMLPRNAEGNHRHAYFKDLHIEEKKDELLSKLIYYSL